MGKKEGRKLVDDDALGDALLAALVVGVDATGAVGVASASDGFAFTGRST